MTDIFEYLAARPYPGRGILIGTSPDGSPLCAYFIMGRSANSRNRVFEKTGDGIRTRAFDEAKMEDPSLIIYHPVRRLGRTLVVTNGDQTDTIRDYLESGGSVYDALASREFEPDAPNYTPRISGVVFPGGDFLLSILRADGAEAPACERFYFTYPPRTGTGRFISTYEGFGGPLPSFSGEPPAFAVPGLEAEPLAERLWACLDADNRVSLYVAAGAREILINKNKER
jgi:IMP cyclohydrolase